MKLTLVSPTGLNLREYNSRFFHLNSGPQQSKLTLTPSMPAKENHTGKNHPVNLPLHQLQKWKGVGGTGHSTTWAGCNTHRTATRPHGTVAFALMPAKDTATGWAGTKAPRNGLLTPKGTRRAQEIARLSGRKRSRA